MQVRNGRAPSLRYASQELCRDPSFMLRAVAEDPKAVGYASKELLQDGDFAEQVLRRCPYPGDAVQQLQPGLQQMSDDILNSLAGYVRNTHNLLQVTMLSGQSCVLVCSPRDTACAIMRRAGTMLVGRPVTGHLLVDGRDNPVKVNERLCDWVGVQVGRLNKVQLVVSQPAEQKDQGIQQWKSSS
mmetsp:Transcript_53842/g.99521  ORF Transcript_53842/g.99521 Transcript_53842/m.99521 type:complete len:185 (+) Transcript_53842:89-643(+)